MRRKGTKKDGKKDVWIGVTIKVYLEGKEPEEIGYRHRAGAGGMYWSTFQATSTKSMLKIEGYRQTFMYNLDKVEKITLQATRSDDKDEQPNHKEALEEDKV
jgi:hypothetical protein